METISPRQRKIRNAYSRLPSKRTVTKIGKAINKAFPYALFLLYVYSHTLLDFKGMNYFEGIFNTTELYRKDVKDIYIVLMYFFMIIDLVVSGVIMFIFTTKLFKLIAWLWDNAYYHISNFFRKVWDRLPD